MKKLIMAAVLSSISFSSLAACYGTDIVKTCTDNNGSTYNVNKYGNTTTVNGYNSNTGNSWSQRSNRVGNSTYTSGTAANGNNWNSTSTTVGGTTYTTGTDSNGNYFSQTCNKYGCY